MALGITRDRPRLAIEARVAEDVAAWEREWRAERGVLRWMGHCDVTGGFPSFVARGGRLDGVHCRITDRYLLIDEGRPHGFGLPLSWLRDVQPAESLTRAEVALCLRYREGGGGSTAPSGGLRAFTLRFRGTRFSLRASRRAGQVLAVLEAGGVARRSEEGPVEPHLIVPWEESRGFESEPVVWGGRVTAPIASGLERAPCDVWLTTESLIWGSGGGYGVHRLPLALVQDVVPAQLEDRVGTPAVSIGFLDEASTRYDLIFLFDRQGHGERNLRERGALLAGLRTRGVSLGTGAPSVQPWRLGGWPLRPPTARPRAVSREVEPVAPVGSADAGSPVKGPLLTIVGGRDRPVSSAIRRPILAAVRSDGDDGVAVAEAGDACVAPTAVTDGPSGMARASAYEAAALAALMDILRAIDDRAKGRNVAPPAVNAPPAAQQAEALAELIEVTATGAVSPEEARVRKERLVALADAGPRLRALLELRDAGYLSDDDLGRKRGAIVAHLSSLIVAG